MGPDPINSSSNSNSCPEVISSNCVGWAGSIIPGVKICKGASITDVITAIGTGCCGTSGTPCYSNTWVDFTSTIPLSGSGAGFTYTVSSFGISGCNTPQYKWTKDGDLKLRGSFKLIVTPSTVNTGAAGIDMVTVPSSCIPNGFNATQFAINAAQLNTTGQLIEQSLTGGTFIDYPSGILTFGFSFISIKLEPITAVIILGGTLNIT